MGGTRLRPVGEGGHIIEDEGVPLAQRPALNFLGDGVVAADSPGKTNVTIPGATPIPPFDFNETALLREEFNSSLAQGVWYKSAEVIADGTKNVLQLNRAFFETSITNAQLLIIFTGRFLINDKIGWRINNLSTATYNQIGTKVKTGDVSVTVVDNQAATEWGFIQQPSAFEPSAIILRLYPSLATGGIVGTLEEFSGGTETSKVSIVNTTNFGSVISVQLFSQNLNNFLLGSKAFLYSLNVESL